MYDFLLQSEVSSFSPSKHDDTWADDTLILQAISQELPDVQVTLGTQLLDTRLKHML